MTPEKFLQEFGMVAGAPEGVKRLREMILQLAVQGKLVEQNPKDEPASVLLGRIIDTKNSLLNSSENSKEKQLPPIQDIEKPFPIHRKWEWIRMGVLTIINGGFAFKSSDYTKDGSRVIRISDFDENGFKDKNIVRHPYADYLKQFQLKEKNILMAMTGGTVGKCFLVKQLPEPMIVNQRVATISTIEGVVPEYLYSLLKSNVVQNVIQDVKNSTNDNISMGSITNFLVPLPPLAEQHRIVAKVDELMSLCDKLEAKQQERDRLYPILSRTNHERFTASPTMENLKAIFETGGTVVAEDLRKTVLELAVRGKLTHRLQTDGDTNELIKRVELTTTHKKSFKPINCINETEYGFCSRNDWQVVQLDDILIFGPTNGISPKAVDYETPVRSLTLSATTLGYFRGEYSKFIPIEVAPDSELWLSDGDILIQRGNSMEYVGVPAIYHGEPNQYVYPDLMIKLRVAPEINADYIHIVLSCSISRNYLRDRATGTSGSMPKINHKALKSLPIPIPPFAEQNRIVTRVNQLFTLIEQIEQKQQSRTQTATLFAQAAVTSITGTQLKDNKSMKAPKTELITKLTLGNKSKIHKDAILALILSKNKGTLTAKALWQASGLEINAFYQILKTEMANGWIEVPEKATMLEVEVAQ